MRPGNRHDRQVRVGVDGGWVDARQSSGRQGVLRTVEGRRVAGRWMRRRGSRSLSG